jgi:primosomal protein N' (replication factor Y)
MKYAEVAVNSPLAQPRTFCYAIPPDMFVSLGQAVWVPFGPRMLQGLVFAVSEEPVVEETREIAELIAPRPVLSPHQVELARWLSERYLSPLFDAAASMLPPGFERRVLTFIEPVSSSSEAALDSLNPKQREILLLLQRSGKMELRQLKKKLKGERVDLVSDQLLRKGLVTKTRELERAKVSPKLVPYLALAVNAERARQEIPVLDKGGAYQQAKLLQLIAESGLVPFSEVKRLGFSTPVAQALKEKGLIAVEQLRVQRDPLAHRTFKKTTPPRLTPAQEAAWHEIRESLRGLYSAEHRDGTPVFLLHGVTGSGKTEIYLHALDQVISLGRRAIVLVPEIALTPQTISRFSARFPGRVAVLHSKLSLGEQFDEWQRIRDGAFDVVIGSRSAIFAPQPDLGLIVIDEEHEWTYKQQDQSPRYHAREVAIKLAQLTGSAVILGSATPDLESYYRAQIGDYRLLQLPERIAEASLPQVEVVDMRQELKQGNRSIFSRSLSQAITKALTADEQVILFLNRRGTASFVQCRDCGFVLRCRRCDISLTYHGTQDSLICHQCGYKMPIPRICPDCFSKRIRFLGIGTQRVEEEVAKAFPNARLLRWDRDVTRGKHSHEEILDRFLAHDADILIGTQMIAKGLDLPLVTLVGVINADIGLYFPDFHSSERTFQILTQVAGRAGRGILGGRVIIQSYSPEHYTIEAAAGHDYQAFYDRELAFRRQQGTPPFNRLARLIYSHTNATLCQREAERMQRLLRAEIDSWGLPQTSLIGPTPAYTQRVRGRYRWQIVIRSPDPLAILHQVPIPQGWVVDIDPISLL